MYFFCGSRGVWKMTGVSLKRNAGNVVRSERGVHCMEGKTGCSPKASFSNMSSQIASPARASGLMRNVLGVASQVLV